MVKINNIKKKLKKISDKLGIETSLVVFYHDEIEIKISDESKIDKVEAYIKKHAEHVKKIIIYRR